MLCYVVICDTSTCTGCVNMVGTQLVFHRALVEMMHAAWDSRETLCTLKFCKVHDLLPGRTRSRLDLCGHFPQRVGSAW